MSVDIPQGRDLCITRVHRRWGMVNIPRIGRVRFRWTKDLPVGKRANAENRVTGARLVKDALGWHIAFRVQNLDPAPESHTGPEVGIDVGVTVPLALSDGRTYDHHAWLTRKEQAKLSRLEQWAAHRKSFRQQGERASRRLRTIYDQIAGIRARAKRRHLDWQHKVTTAIAARYSVVHKVPAPGTSQRCSMCGFTTPGSGESQAVFVCKNPDCGWVGNADHNGARNVLHLYRMGLALVPAAGRAVVRRACRVKPATAR